jgi:hypothetical protein
MSRILNRFKTEMVRQSIAIISSNTEPLYVFAARPSSWGVVPEEKDNIFDSQLEPWRQMMFGVKVDATDVAYMTRRYNWESGKIYTQYDHNPAELGRPELNFTQFYVLVDEARVYKCISNNRRVASTVKPTSLDKGVPVEYADGYVWMYLYEITNPQKIQFLTDDFMPVFEDAETKAAAVDGAIFSVEIVNGGVDYPFHEGTANIAAASNQRWTLFTNPGVELRQAAFTPNYFRNCAITFTDNLGQQDVVTIINSEVVGENIVVDLVRAPEGIAITNGIQFSVAPRIEVGGFAGLTVSSFEARGLNRPDSAIDAIAYAKVNPDNGAIASVTMINPGTLYTEADARVVSGSGFGSGASLRPILSPPGGHGSNVYDELFSINLGISVRFTGNNIPFNVSYSQVGLLADPKAYANTAALYGAKTFNMVTEVSVQSIGGSTNFVAGEQIYAVGSSKRGTVAYANSTVIGIIGVAGSDNNPATPDQFSPDETLSNLNASKQFRVVGVTSTPEVAIFKGSVQYLQNLNLIDRSAATPEQVKLVIRFGT